jgi:hypothetical protein
MRHSARRWVAAVSFARWLCVNYASSEPLYLAGLSTTYVLQTGMTKRDSSSPKLKKIAMGDRDKKEIEMPTINIDIPDQGISVIGNDKFVNCILAERGRLRFTQGPLHSPKCSG